MGVFDRLFGGKGGAAKEKSSGGGANLRPPRPGRPTYADAVPGKVEVDFHVHDNVEGVTGNFLTAVTEGLAKSRQRELVLTLRLPADEDPNAKMQDIVRFVATVYAWASEGNIVDEGSFTRFGARGLFGRAHSGLLYAEARPIEGIRLPERGLSAIVVDAQEISTALEYGTYRVLTRLGLEQRVFPFPTWSELDRPSTATTREAESALAKLARLPAPSVYFVFSEQCLRVSIPYDSSRLFSGLRALPANAPFVLFTRPAPSANSIFVWTPGQAGTSGISAEGSDGSLLSGSCLMVVPGGQRDQVRPLEDGYSVLFSNDSWGQLSASLVNQQPVSLQMADGMRFVVEWLAKPERNPNAGGFTRQ